MLKFKSALLIPAVGFLSRGVLSQSATKNNTVPLYIPLGTLDGGPDDGGVVVASSITVQDSSTIFQLVESFSTADPETLTLASSPTGARLTGSDDADGIPMLDVSCAISAGQSTCQVIAVLVSNGTTATSTTVLTETAAPVTVIAENFAASSTPAPNTSTGAGSSNPSPTSPAANPSPTSPNGNPTPTTTDTSPSATQTGSATVTRVSLTFVSIIALGLSWHFV